MRIHDGVSYSQPAASIRRYLADHAGEFRRLAFFGVARTARAADSAFDEMQSLCRGQAAPRLWCPLGIYGGGDPIGGLQGFMHALREGAARPSTAQLPDPHAIEHAQARTHARVPVCKP
jgi:hypothetical protein